MIKVEPLQNAITAADLETGADESTAFGICMGTLTQASAQKWSETDITSSLSADFGPVKHNPRVQSMLPRSISQLMGTAAGIVSIPYSSSMTQARTRHVADFSAAV